MSCAMRTMRSARKSVGAEIPPSRSSSWRGGSWVRSLAILLLASGALGACSLDGLLKSNVLPPDVTDPAITQTPVGARAAYSSALRGLQDIYGSPGVHGIPFPAATGLLSDELTGRVTTAFGFGYVEDPLSLRQLAETPSGLSTDDLFKNLNNLRQRARQAIGLLGDYLPAEPALQGKLYAVQGYAEVMLAELFCSGIPLSTVDYKGDYTLRPGSSSAEVFAHAVALFDTALTLAGDSARILNLSRVGRARALLGAGDYAGAAVTIAQVPDDFHYTLYYASTANDSTQGFGYNPPGGNEMWDEVGVANREGTNGLPYRSSDDPRTKVTLADNGFYHPDKYASTGVDSIIIASGVEARLIAAEDALHRGDAGWLDTLNHLRETAITPALPDTTDPGAALSGVAADSARVDLLFRERAFWLFLTGHRQGDMRRLVRQYHRSQSQVYPIGTSQYGGTYGPYVDVPVPWDERTLNPLYTGCGSRD